MSSSGTGAFSSHTLGSFEIAIVPLVLARTSRVAPAALLAEATTFVPSTLVR